MDGPDSLYSCFVINILSNVVNELRIAPPIHTANFLSDSAAMRIFADDGANAVISFCIRSIKPGKKVDPTSRKLLLGIYEY